MSISTRSISSPPSPTDIDDLIAGRVDGLTAYISNEPFQMKQRQVPYRLISPKDYNINFYSDILFTSQRFLGNHPEHVKAFREAVYQGWRYTAEHPAEIIELVFNHYNPTHKTREQLQFEAEQLLPLSLYPTVDFGHMTRSRWEHIADIYQRLGLYNTDINLDGFLYQDDERSDWRLWLSLGLIALVPLLLTVLMLKRHHHKRLEAHIREHTPELKQELEKRQKLEAMARHESLRLHSLLDNTIDSVITINHLGIIENYNKASIQLYGYQPEEVIGQNITMLMPDSYRDRHKLGMARFLSTEQSRFLGKPVELEAQHKNGKIFPIELTIGNFRWQGQYLFTGIARDISQHKAEQQALIEAKREAEHANQAKSEFLSTMSHELRTPLNGILGFAQLLLNDREQPLSPQQSQHIQQIIHSGNHLLTLINDVLELSETEAGNMRISYDRITISSIFEACLPMLQTLARQYDVLVELADYEDCTIVADFTKLKQVFINLVSNAIKYNQTGGKVFISTQIQMHNKTMKLTVSDTGQGIPVEKQQHVFTAFERLGQEYADIEGSGVGLNISQRLIKAMNGHIDFASTEGQGSQFWIELPLSTTQASVTSASSQALPPVENTPLLERRSKSRVSKQSRKVLYIEDNPADIRLMEAFFSRYEQLELHCCDNAEAGLSLLKTMTPDLILMDFNLPGMNGIQLCQIMQENQDLKTIPVIALTAKTRQQNTDISEGLFKAYITKPVDFSLLSKTLQSYL